MVMIKANQCASRHGIMMLQRDLALERWKEWEQYSQQVLECLQRILQLAYIYVWHVCSNTSARAGGRIGKVYMRGAACMAYMRTTGTHSIIVNRLLCETHGSVRCAGISLD